MRSGPVHLKDPRQGSLGKTIAADTAHEVCPSGQRLSTTKPRKNNALKAKKL